MRSAVYDEGLGAEAFRFTGMARPFPAHFHEGYVFGLVERGLRTVSCGGRTLEAGPGTVLVFHPGESHSCRGEGALDYRGLFLPAETLARWTGDARPPRFADNGFAEKALAEAFAALHRRMMARAPEAAREEARLAFLARLLPHRRDAEEAPGRAEVARALAYMADHLAESVRTEDLCRAAGLSRSALLRAFVREKGLTPYRAGGAPHRTGAAPARGGRVSRGSGGPHGLCGPEPLHEVFHPPHGARARAVRGAVPRRGAPWVARRVTASRR